MVPHPQHDPKGQHPLDDPGVDGLGQDVIHCQPRSCLAGAAAEVQLEATLGVDGDDLPFDELTLRERGGEVLHEGVVEIFLHGPADRFAGGAEEAPVGSHVDNVCFDDVVLFGEGVWGEVAIQAGGSDGQLVGALLVTRLGEDAHHEILPMRIQPGVC